MSSPLVSIIIPTYNRSHLISETLDSVFVQTYANWECIIVDDGSTDNTEEIVIQYLKKDPRFQYHKRPDTHKPGGNGARNYGFEVSKGEFVNYLDSDDFLYKETLKTKVKYAVENNADVVISKHTRQFDELTDNVGDFKVFESNTFYEDFILARNSILIGDPFIKRKSALNLRFDQSLKRGQDHDYFIRLFENKLVYCLIDAKLYFYDYTEGSITVKAGKGSSEMIDTQISIHKAMMKKYSDNSKIIEEYKRKTKKMYIRLMQKGKYRLVLKHFRFYSYCFNKNRFVFFLFFIYNLITKRGFDVLKIE